VTDFNKERKLLAPRPTNKLENHPLSAVHDCLYEWKCNLCQDLLSYILWRPVVCWLRTFWMNTVHPSSEDVDRRFLRNIRVCLPDYTISHPGKQYHSQSPHLRPRISDRFVTFSASENCLQLNFRMPVMVAERSEACTVFARSEAGIVDSNPTQGMDV
jgi:hypothetical protein